MGAPARIAEAEWLRLYLIALEQRIDGDCKHAKERSGLQIGDGFALAVLRLAPRRASPTSSQVEAGRRPVVRRAAPAGFDPAGVHAVGRRQAAAPEDDPVTPHHGELPERHRCIGIAALLHFVPPSKFICKY